MKARLKSIGALFRGRHHEREIIVLCVRWYLRYKLSLRDLVDMMAERGPALAHTTILRWVQRFVPEFGKRWNRFARPAGRPVVALRRNLREDPRRLALPVPSGLS